MKIIITASILVVVNTYTLNDDSHISSKWKEFQKKYSKVYESDVEAEKRFNIFKENLERIIVHNDLYDRGSVFHRKGLNVFGDWSKEEFLQFLRNGSQNAKPRKRRNRIFKHVTNYTLPSSIDWRNHGAVTAVKDQGFCGACYAFSAIGGLEGQLKIVKGQLISLSEQNLIDCSADQGNSGCAGGLITQALDYIKKFGIRSEVDYPYFGTEADCQHDKNKIITDITGYVNIREGSEEDLQHAIATIGPVSVSIDATFELQAYDSGILDDRFCTTYELNHGVLVVGYGIENGLQYYLVKNSWGKDWGDDGYFKIVRNQKNRCGIATLATYPVI
ncbi:hypothetical protein HHI36_014824 [Cryptolaemus montrouzieri]|uniref:Cathepsin L n=1 Tax=Cryptolaemus montrouzieri TaxID=559131 RepID=A0ABD2N3U7_9CUCU